MKALKQFIDANQNRINVGDEIPNGLYSAPVIAHYKHHKMVCETEEKKTLPQQSKNTKPESGGSGSASAVKSAKGKRSR